MKRLLDVGVSAAALVLLSPLLLLMAIWIKLDSPGPVVFRQTRVGRFGRPFTIYKFRSMRAEGAPGAPAITPAGDSRITNAGRFLRKWKLDELPQLMNVLVGDMSLVGPRPEVPGYVELYPADQRTLVLSVRPGITDEASIEFRDEGTLLAGADDPQQLYIEQILPRKLQIYADYARHHTMLGDLFIVLRTLRQLLT